MTEELVKAVRTISEMGLENDKAILQVVQLLVKRVIDLEARVQILMDYLHLQKEN